MRLKEPFLLTFGFDKARPEKNMPYSLKKYITQKVHQVLATHTETYRTLLYPKNHEGCFFTLDAFGRFKLISGASKGFLPCSDKTLIGKHFWELFNNWKNAGFEKEIKKKIKEKKAIEFEIPNGKKWYQIYFAPADKGVVGHMIDITKRKEKEAELKLSCEEMEGWIEQRTRQLAEASEALKAEIAERKKVEQEILEIGEQEQRNLGEHIHDNLCQNLAGILMLTKMLAKKLDRHGLEEAKELREIAGLLNDSITQAREIARGVYPVEMEGNSLMISLQGLAARMSGLYGIHCTFASSQPVLIHDNNLATHLYRIAQEAIRNSVVHGEAKQVKIYLNQIGSRMQLVIKDNGKGLGPSAQGGGIGMQIMKYRARRLNAVLDIQNSSPCGTVLTCSFLHPVLKGNKNAVTHSL